MTFWYTARGTFDKDFGEDGISWGKYIEWSKLSHLIELVSLDTMLNEILVKPDRNNADDWNYIVTDKPFETGFYRTLEFVLKKMAPIDRFNLLTVVVEPTEDCKTVKLENYDFVGYDLLEQDYRTSALTNCGGFNETFLPSELNNYGLIDEYEKAFDVKKRLLENNPEEIHADTNVIAVWRHQKIGRKIEILGTE